VHANAPLILRAPLNLSALAVTHLKAVSEHEECMKIALPALPGLAPGALGGAALRNGAGLASVEIFKTTRFEGDSGRSCSSPSRRRELRSAVLGVRWCSVSSRFATPKSSSSASLLGRDDR
jgi:hypothetical protein